MKEFNLSFLLFFIDERSPAVVKERMEEVLCCPLRIEEADAPIEERANSFQGDVLGMEVLLRLAYTWPEGNVYKFNGVVNKHLYSVTGEKLIITSHMLRFLEHAGFQSVMTREAFVEICDRKGL